MAMTFDPTTAPVAGKEPMLLLDTSASMNYAAAAESTTPRHTVIGEAISLVVEALAKEDSEAAHEKGGGGLRTVTFASGDPIDLEDLNTTNLRQKWDGIVWDGGTMIMKGWKKLMEVYAEEFGDRTVSMRPKLLALIITDGEARDYQEFVQTIKGLSGNIYIEMAIIGYGADHDRALKAYQAAASQNPAHIEVKTLGSQTDPEEIARALLAMIE
jgi:hypothetical protein